MSGYVAGMYLYVYTTKFLQRYRVMHCNLKIIFLSNKKLRDYINGSIFLLLLESSIFRILI